MTNHTLKDLREGKVCLRNDGTPAMLERVLHYVFPEDTSSPIPNWKYLYFGKSKHSDTHWVYSDSTEYFGVRCLPVQHFIDEIAREKQLVYTTDSLQKAIKDLKFRALEIGLDVEILFKPRER
jgi:hypothetical protein